MSDIGYAHFSIYYAINTFVCMMYIREYIGHGSNDTFCNCLL